MIRNIVYLLLATVISACSTNGWLISGVYNRVDNLLVDGFTEYADFNEQQLGWIEAMAVSYHDWHRTSQLPRYAQFMREVEVELGGGGMLSRAQTDSWITTALEFSMAVEDCNPLNNAFPLLVSLSDEQVVQVAAELERTYQDHISELESHDPQQRLERRFKRISKWLDRVGLRLNAQQRSLLRATLARHRSFQRDGLDLWRAWNGEFIGLLEQRRAADFQPLMRRQLTGLWNLSKDRYPAEWEANYQLWVDFFHQLFTTQTDQQRDRFGSWLRRIATTLDGLAQPRDKQLVEFESCGGGDQVAIIRDL